MVIDMQRQNDGSWAIDDPKPVNKYLYNQVKKVYETLDIQEKVDYTFRSERRLWKC